MRQIAAPLIIFLYFFQVSAYTQAGDECPATESSETYIQQLERRMEQHDAEAALTLAEYYHQGRCTKSDLTKSRLIYEQLAKEGNAEAEFRLALIYLNGFGVPANKITAEIWLNKAIKHHHPAARQLLEYIHEIGFDDC